MHGRIGNRGKWPVRIMKPTPAVDPGSAQSSAETLAYFVVVGGLGGKGEVQLAIFPPRNLTV
jgi:hypothetical protein